jgi:hypothetical protein
MKRLDERILIFLYGAILIMLGTLGSAEKIILVVARATPSVRSVEDTARPN